MAASNLLSDKAILAALPPLVLVMITTGFFGASAAPLVPAANPFAVATAFTPSGTDADNVVKSDTAALYLQDQVAINPQWKVLAGVRHDRFSVHFDDRRSTTPAVIGTGPCPDETKTMRRKPARISDSHVALRNSMPCVGEMLIVAVAISVVPGYDQIRPGM